MSKKRHFSQEEKHTILMSARDIGVDKPSRPGRGEKHITEKQEKEILGVWEKNPGYGPGQVRNQLRRQGINKSFTRPPLIDCL